MKDEVVLLSNYLRNEGMSVSIRSTVLAHHIFNNMRDLMTYDELYNSLKIVYVKDIEDNEKFERGFKKVFDKIELKPEPQPESQEAIEEYDNNQTEEMTQQPPASQPNLDELQELYDQMVKEKAESKAKEGRMLDGSMLLLDTFDPRVFELCRKLGRKIANKRSKRKKRNNSHHIDMPKTIRSNIKYGGHCINLIKSKPPMKKTNHIFLCDVSGSCEWITAWFFLLLYGCKRTFNKMKVYNFDNKITDVTDLLELEKFRTIGQVNVAQRAKGISCYGQSDMAKSFEEFLEIAEITNRTDIIILTDCRDWKGKRENGILQSASLMKTMKTKAHDVIILNPEKKIRWNNQTSCVKDYEKMGVRVFETSSLDKFEKVISEL